MEVPQELLKIRTTKNYYSEIRELKTEIKKVKKELQAQLKVHYDVINACVDWMKTLQDENSKLPNIVKKKDLESENNLAKMKKKVKEYEFTQEDVLKLIAEVKRLKNLRELKHSHLFPHLPEHILQMKKLLRKAEWIKYDLDGSVCFECSYRQPRHKDDCRVDAALNNKLLKND